MVKSTDTVLRFMGVLHQQQDFATHVFIRVRNRIFLIVYLPSASTLQDQRLIDNRLLLHSRATLSPSRICHIAARTSPTPEALSLSLRNTDAALFLSEFSTERFLKRFTDAIFLVLSLEALRDILFNNKSAFSSLQSNKRYQKCFF